MKQFTRIAILFALLTSCESEPQAKAIDSYENGQAALVEYINDAGEKVKEERFHQNGQLHMFGTYKNGLRHGPWKSYYEDGTLWSDNYFVDGNNEGDYANYFENGQIRMKGQYAGGSKTGKWSFFDENGVLVKEAEF